MAISINPVTATRAPAAGTQSGRCWVNGSGCARWEKPANAMAAASPRRAWSRQDARRRPASAAIAVAVARMPRNNMVVTSNGRFVFA